MIAFFLQALQEERAQTLIDLTHTKATLQDAQANLLVSKQCEQDVRNELDALRAYLDKARAQREESAQGVREALNKISDEVLVANARGDSADVELAAVHLKFEAVSKALEVLSASVSSSTRSDAMTSSGSAGLISAANLQMFTSEVVRLSEALDTRSRALREVTQERDAAKVAARRLETEISHLLSEQDARAHTHTACKASLLRAHDVARGHASGADLARVENLKLRRQISEAEREREALQRALGASENACLRLREDVTMANAAAAHARSDLVLERGAIAGV